MDKGVLWIAKRVYIGECVGSHSVGRLQKRWTDTLKECLKKRGLDVRQARRLVQDRSEMVEVCEWGGIGGSPRDELLTLMRCHNYMKPLKGGSQSVVKPTIYRT